MLHNPCPYPENQIPRASLRLPRPEWVRPWVLRWIPNPYHSPYFPDNPRNRVPAYSFKHRWSYTGIDHPDGKEITGAILEHWEINHIKGTIEMVDTAYYDMTDDTAPVR